MMNNIEKMKFIHVVQKKILMLKRNKLVIESYEDYKN